MTKNDQNGQKPELDPKWHPNLILNKTRKIDQNPKNRPKNRVSETKTRPKPGPLEKVTTKPSPG